MNIELSDNEIKFLIRALVMNYADIEEDFVPDDISASNQNSAIIGKFLSGMAKRDEYSKAKNNRYLKDRLPPKPLFLGAGWHSIIHTNMLHKRLQYAVSELGGNQQNGGMGSTFKYVEDQEATENIKNVLRDLITAFGMTTDDLKD